MTDSNRRMTHAALVAALIASPVFAASDPAAIEQQLNALQQALARQQEQLAQQQQEIERLRQQIAASSSGGAAVEQIADEVQQAKQVQRASTTSGSVTRDSRRSRSRSEHSRRLPTWTTESTSRVRCSSSAPRRLSYHVRQAEPTVASASVCAAAVRVG